MTFSGKILLIALKAQYLGRKGGGGSGAGKEVISFLVFDKSGMNLVF